MSLRRTKLLKKIKRLKTENKKLKKLVRRYILKEKAVYLAHSPTTS